MNSLRGYLIAIGISGGLSWLGFILTVINTNPNNHGPSALLAFYISLFFGLLGLVTLIGYAIRRALWRQQGRMTALRDALRQGWLSTTLGVTLLVLQSMNLLTWWDILLLGFLTTLVELYLRANAKLKPIR